MSRFSRTQEERASLKDTRGVGRVLRTSLIVVGMTLLLAVPSFAHCDGMDGPVVKAAQEALARGDVSLVLVWVSKSDEAEIRQAFERTVDVRKQGPQAKALADTWFFETLVRLHRAGEGEPFTGLKPAGRDLGPAIPAADLALKSGDVGPLTNLVSERVRAGILERYKQASAARNYKSDDVAAGREYVEKYVTFLHYVEGVFEAATGSTGHGVEGSEALHPEK